MLPGAICTCAAPAGDSERWLSKPCGISTQSMKPPCGWLTRAVAGKCWLTQAVMRSRPRAYWLRMRRRCGWYWPSPMNSASASCGNWALMPVLMYFMCSTRCR